MSAGRLLVVALCLDLFTALLVFAVVAVASGWEEGLLTAAFLFVAFLIPVLLNVWVYDRFLRFRFRRVAPGPRYGLRAAFLFGLTVLGALLVNGLLYYAAIQRGEGDGSFAKMLVSDVTPYLPVFGLLALLTPIGARLADAR